MSLFNNQFIPQSYVIEQYSTGTRLVISAISMGRAVREAIECFDFDDTAGDFVVFKNARAWFFQKREAPILHD